MQSYIKRLRNLLLGVCSEQFANLCAFGRARGRRLVMNSVAAEGTAAEVSLQPFPWYGIDIGGTLVKIVYFEPTKLDENIPQDEIEVLKSVRNLLLSSVAYGQAGVRDAVLEIKVSTFRWVNGKTRKDDYLIV